MDLTTYQLWERRNAADQITRPGAFGKNTALTNGQNTGILDYITNDLDVLYNEQQNFVGLVWHASTAYSAGTVIIVGGGKVAKCTTAGTSGTTAPTWAVGNVTDGTVVWAVSDVINGYYTKTETDNLLNGKLSLSGGTITGNIRFNNAGIISDGTTSNQFRHIDGQCLTENGDLYFNYHNETVDVYKSIIFGNNGLSNHANGKYYQGRFYQTDPNGGTLYPCDAIVASGSNYIRYQSGLQICWGIYAFTETVVGQYIREITLPLPFNNYGSYQTLASFSDIARGGGIGATDNNVGIVWQNSISFAMLIQLHTAYDENNLIRWISVGTWR